jgi:hypothetical protein
MHDKNIFYLVKYFDNFQSHIAMHVKIQSVSPVHSDLPKSVKDIVEKLVFVDPQL